MVRRLVSIVVLAAAAAAHASPDAADVERLVIQHTNAFRTSHSRPPLEPQPQLANAAREFARFMARTGRYGHEADGRDAARRATAHGFAHCLIAENIARVLRSPDFESRELADALLSGWRESPPHRANMLDTDATHIGVGLARSDSGRHYAVQLFGRPEERKIEFRIANRTTSTLHYELDGERLTIEPRATTTHTHCRTPRLVLALPGEQPATLQPRGGERYVVERAAGRHRVSGG